MNPSLILKEEKIASLIYFIRGEKVIFDSDLSLLYGVPTKVLKQAVKRNRDRFPEDFMFELSREEHDSLRSQIATLNLRSQIVTSNWGGSRYVPMAFTEQGVAMLSSVLRSKRAIEVNIAIVRAFVQMRKLLQDHQELAKKIKELEKLTEDRFAKHDEKFRLIFEAIQQLMRQENEPRIPIGFKIKNEALKKKS